MSGVVIDPHDHGAWDAVLRQLQPGTVPEGNIFIVVFAADGKHVGTMRLAMPDPPEPGLLLTAAAGFLRSIRTRQWTTAASCVVVAYGPAHITGPAVDMTRTVAVQAGMDVADAVRVYGPRCWSYLCPDPDHHAGGPGLLMDLLSDTAIQVATVLELARDQEPG